MTARFEKAYNALVNAYFEGTLAKGICVACAVGNIVAVGAGARINVSELPWGDPLYECLYENDFWGTLFSTSKGIQRKYVTYPNGMTFCEPYKTLVCEEEMAVISKQREKLLRLTGYSDVELAEVEKAFETNTKIDFTNYKAHTEQEVLEDQFNGLSAAVDVLVRLDNIENENKQYNKKFREHPLLCAK